MQNDTKSYSYCKRLLDTAIAHHLVIGEQNKWAVLCENGVLDEYPYQQVITHLTENGSDRKFLITTSVKPPSFRHGDISDRGENNYAERY